MNIAVAHSDPASAEQIPYVTAAEASTLMQTALDRLIRLLESLDLEDWDRPTPCTEWNVRDMVAHQAGGYASGTGYREMLRQYTARPRAGQLPEDAINSLQLAERAGRSAADLIAELKRTGTRAIHNWAYGFRLIKWISIQHPIAGRLSLRHLMWVIHSRDTWMHRLDICRATGRPFEQTREHDGRINELVLLDVAGKLTGRLGPRAMTLVLDGAAGGAWKIGRGYPQAQIEMDALDFNIFVSGRFSYEQAMERAAISGDRALVESALKDLLILY